MVSLLCILDEYENAEQYSSRKREILPKSYRSEGRKCTNYDFAYLHHDDEEEGDTISAEKIAERLKIQEKINALDNEYFDLNDSEIEEFQQLLDADDNDRSIEWLDEDEDFPQPFNFKSEILHLETITEKPIEETMENGVSTNLIYFILNIDRIIPIKSQHMLQKQVHILMASAKDQMGVWLINQMEHRWMR